MPRRRRRRGGKGRGQRQPASPRSSEDLVRADPRPQPDRLTLEPDGQTLEGIIGDLQSQMGIPQYPQEYRITIKVAEEGGRAAAIQETVQDPPDRNGSDGGPRREKAPAAPRIGGGIARVLTGGSDDGAGGARGGRRRRRKRKRGRGPRGPGGGGGNDGSGGTASAG